MLRMRQFRAIRIPPIFYLYVLAVLAMSVLALSRIGQI
jgi:hypothetical protein